MLFNSTQRSGCCDQHKNQVLLMLIDLQACLIPKFCSHSCQSRPQPSKLPVKCHLFPAFQEELVEKQQLVLLHPTRPGATPHILIPPGASVGMPGFSCFLALVQPKGWEGRPGLVPSRSRTLIHHRLQKQSWPPTQVECRLRARTLPCPFEMSSYLLGLSPPPSC